MKKILLSLLASALLTVAQAYTLNGIVLNTNDDSVVSDAIILLLQDKKVVATATSNFQGEFKINCKKNKIYKIEVVKDGFKPESAELNINDAFVDASPTITVYLQSLMFSPDLSDMQKGMEEKELNPDIMEDVGEISELPEGYKIIEAKPLKMDKGDKSKFNVNLDKEKANTKVNVNVLKETFNKESVANMVHSDKEKFPSSYFADGNVYYGAGKALLTNDVEEMIQHLAIKLKSEPDVKMRITAYADGKQEAEIGDYIGKLRAEELTKYFIAQGVSFEQLLVSVIGNTAVPNDCEKGVECTEFEHQENRRVALTFE